MGVLLEQLGAPDLSLVVGGARWGGRMVLGILGEQALSWRGCRSQWVLP